MNKTERLISQIIDLTVDKLKYDPDKNYVCVGIYDCGGSWQVWMNYGKSGKIAKKTVFFYTKTRKASESYLESNTLESALLELRNTLDAPKTKLYVER